jgi:glycosyltransferase involved in cell wall biosynthesis
MKTILFLTAAYPYYPGEQFIENEIDYWAEQANLRVILVPLSASGKPRGIPANINVDCSLARGRTLTSTLASLAMALTSKIFWKEVGYIFSIKGVNLRCCAQALKTSSKVLLTQQGLKKICAKHSGAVIAYCYWNDVQFYAAALLKRAGLVSKLVSRAHGFDLYESRRPDSYMPLKRQFIYDADDILAISNKGKAYLQETYNAPPKHVVVSPLGVQIPTLISSVGEFNYLNIVSVSFCVSVKRIDKIIDAIADSSLRLNPVRINWTHIGDGPLLSSLESQAAIKLTPLNIQWRLLGNLSNTEVRQYYENNLVDIFINTSESEGVPVSIMEAMSYGVPVIAPDIGGISELVSNENGCLLSQAPTIFDIANALVSAYYRFKEAEIRVHAKQKIIDAYSAESNYRSIVQLIAN